MKDEITFEQVVKWIEELQCQNSIDFQGIKNIKESIKKLNSEITKAKNLNNSINKKILSEYEKIKKIILDENISVSLDNKISNVNKLLNDLKSNVYSLEDGQAFEKKTNESIKAISSQLDNIANEKVNVKMFGAKGDGYTDDTDAFKQAISSVSLGGQIYIPFGTYIINEQLKLPNSSISFIGANQHKSILKANSTMDSIIFQEYSSDLIRHITFEKLTFECNKRSSNGIYIQRSNGLKITECSFLNHKNSGIYLNTLDEIEGGAKIYESIISKNYFRGVAGTLNESSEALEEMPNYNIYIGRGATDNLITENITINAKVHIYNRGGNNIFSSNHCFDYPNPQYDSDTFICCDGDGFIHDNFFDNAKCAVLLKSDNQQICDNRFFWANQTTFNRDNYCGIKIDVDGYIPRFISITGNFFRGSFDKQVGYDIQCINSEVQGVYIEGNLSNYIKNVYPQMKESKKLNVFTPYADMFLGSWGSGMGYITYKNKKGENAIKNKLEFLDSLTKIYGDEIVSVHLKNNTIKFMNDNFHSLESCSVGTNGNRFDTIFLKTAPNVSSRRDLKEEINKYDDELAYQGIKNLNIYSYKLKDRPAGNEDVYFGTMLDELPNECKHDEGVDLYGYTSYCVSALKTAISKIEKLEKIIIENKSTI